MSTLSFLDGGGGCFCPGEERGGGRGGGGLLSYTPKREWFVKGVRITKHCQ